MINVEECYDYTINPGEIMYYPKDFWHQTESIDPLSISVTGTIIDDDNIFTIIEEFLYECRAPRGTRRISLNDEVCESLRNKCMKQWLKMFAMETPKNTCSST